MILGGAPLSSAPLASSGAVVLNAYSLACDTGAFTLTGNAAAFVHNYPLTAAAGSFTLSGQASGLKFGHKLAMAAGSFTLAGQDIALRHATLFSAAVGAFTFSGQAAGLLGGKKVGADAAAFTLTGNSAAFARTWNLVSAAGSFSLSGQAIAFLATRRIAAGVGTFTFTGNDATTIVLVYERPESDVAPGGWTTHLGSPADLWDEVNERGPPDDSDYIKSSDLETGQSDPVEIGLSDQPLPPVLTHHTIRYRYRKSVVSGSLQMNLTVELYCGATLIASWDHTNVGTSWVTAEQTLSTVEAGNITDYSDLRIKMTAEAA